MRIFYSTHHLKHATQDVLIEGNALESEEIPDRAEEIHEALLACDWAQIAPPADFGMDPLLIVHNADYLNFLQHAYKRYCEHYHTQEPAMPGTFTPRSGVRRKPTHIYGQLGYYAYGVGTPILEGTWEASYWAAQCTLSAADAVRNGDKVAYALCRPPGHHALRGALGGFCYINNAAIAAQHLRTGGKRVAILDIDYHHGNGTQEIFYSEPEVLYCSLHIHPDLDYPYFWGVADEIGIGPGKGYNRNWPLPAGIDDDGYLAVLAQALEVIGAYAPDYLVVSLGLDTFDGDPVGGFKISRNGLSEIGNRINSLWLPTVIVQEGGYLIDKLGENAVAFLQAFAVE